MPKELKRAKRATPSTSCFNCSDWCYKKALKAVTNEKESVWFIIVFCLFTVGSVKFLQLSFVIWS